MNKFKVIVPSFNCIEYLPRCLASIEGQSYTPDAVCIIDDASTLPQQREIILDFCTRNKWHYRFHERNHGTVYGLVQGIKEFNCEDDDIIVAIDGDDWLAHSEVFSYLNQVYSSNDIYLTWGQCEKYPVEKNPMRCANNIPERVIDRKLFREIRFVFSHLHTFKYLLWKNIKDEDLRDQNGVYFRILSDLAMYYPMLEMAGRKIKFIKETLYIYNAENPLNDAKITPKEEWDALNQFIRSKPPYQTLDRCK
jgi:glycosyltransferase involved in cell wall biosynthesis